ncbi:hypothetical protein FQN57_006566 [Myotisia sp. PD_48]|nr:hypothetical protein FQN57_006566 [Myotisia sp. PD_48]
MKTVGTTPNGEPHNIIQDKVYAAVRECAPPSTRHNCTTSSTGDLSEYLQDFGAVLERDLDSLYVDVPEFCKTLFGSFEGLEAAAQTVLDKCKDGEDPLYHEETGWRGFTAGAPRSYVLTWLTNTVIEFSRVFEQHTNTSNIKRRPLTKPYVKRSIAVHKLAIGLATDPNASLGMMRNWSHIFTPGELENHPRHDIVPTAWVDPAGYVIDEIPHGGPLAQASAIESSRRFVLGFSLCRSSMRLWHLDRLGGITSDAFDINKDGLRFVLTVLGFLQMNQQQLGFDPTLATAIDGSRYIEIVRNGEVERLIIDEQITRTPWRSAGRGTICWRAHREGDRSKTPLVIKDSWQYPELAEEGGLLREAREAGVVSVARYYHHETVRVDGIDDDIRNIRKGLDIRKGKRFMASKSESPLSRARSRTATKDGGSKRKRSSISIDPMDEVALNRVHRRIIVEDYGKPIYTASSVIAFLQAMVDCLDGPMSLYNKTGLIHSDISPYNLMIDGNGRGFIIDLDVATREDRGRPTEARQNTGNRAFMSIHLLLGKQHFLGERRSFMDDLESFFWVIFWVCLHYEGPGEEIVQGRYDVWNYMEVDALGYLKAGIVSTEWTFMRRIERDFSSYYAPLAKYVNKLRHEVFPHDRSWAKEDVMLVERMKKILRDAMVDPDIQNGG